MATGPQAFYCLWQEERVRETLFELLPKEDICAVRLANSACCNLVTKRLFLRTHLTFTTNTFTKPSRIQALSRIGHHVEHLTFHFAHSDATFLPPLIHPLTGREISFLYTPHTSMASVLARPKYANSELGDILTQQYPPLFHAATNVPSFINAMRHLPNMRHLTIKCPGQDPTERYRRDIVDYALVSLRISLERAPLGRLNKLSLSGVHPSAFNYLRHVPGFGCMPSAGRRWRQIRKLYIAVDSWDFYGPSPGLDHLKIIDDYVRSFAPNLEKFSFTWLGRKGPCPVALSGDPLFAPPRSTKKLFNEVTGPMSPLPPAPCRQPMRFPRLRYLTVRNATMNAPQLRQLVSDHRETVREFDFENVALVGGGSWDDALAPLMEQKSDHHSDVWSRHSAGGSGSEAESFRTAAASATASSASEDVELPSPSAAVAAASRELLDLDVEGLERFLGFGEGGGMEQPELEQQVLQERPAAIEEEGEEEGEGDDGLASDVAAAREASLSFSTKIKKRRVRRRRRRRHREDGGPEESEVEERERSRSRSRSAHSRHHHHHHHHHDGRHHSRHRKDSHHEREEEEPVPPLPTSNHPYAHLSPPQLSASGSIISAADSIINNDDDVFRPQTPKPKPNPRSNPRFSPKPPPSPSAMTISAPLLAADPPASVVLLQPTVYDPMASSVGIGGGVPGLGSGGMSPPPTPPDDGLSAVQRAIEQGEAQRRLMAEDADARTSALRRAKEAVLAKLSREFNRRIGREVPSSGSGRYAGGDGGGVRFRERLFGESLVSVAHQAGMHAMHSVHSVHAAHAHDYSRHPSMESNSALVPLMFSRA